MTVKDSFNHRSNEKENNQSNENIAKQIESSDIQLQTTNDEERIDNNKTNERSHYISNRPLCMNDGHITDFSDSSDESLYCSFFKENNHELNSSFQDPNSTLKSTHSEPRITPHENNRSASSMSQLQEVPSIHSTPRLNTSDKHLLHQLSLNDSQLTITSNVNNDQTSTENNGKTKIGQFDHCDLLRAIVDVESIDDNLSGIVYINNAEPVNHPQKQTKSKYAMLRKLFKSTGSILRTLQYTDQGHINADILQNYLHIHNEDDEEIKKKVKIYLIYYIHFMNQVNIIILIYRIN